MEVLGKQPLGLGGMEVFQLGKLLVHVLKESGGHRMGCQVEGLMKGRSALF